MRDYVTFKRSAIRYWERGRIVYNLALLLPALTGYIIAAGLAEGLGGSSRSRFSVVVFCFVVSAFGANICYSFSYTLEFLFGSDEPDSRWLRFWRPLLVVLGTLFGMYLALLGGRDIAVYEYAGK